MSNKSKDFSAKNPAMAFISRAEEQQDDKNINVDNNAKNKVNRSKKETKSKRLNLVIRPSLYQDVEKIAYMKKNSPNDQISKCLEEYVESNQDLIDKYDAIFQE